VEGDVRRPHGPHAGGGGARAPRAPVGHQHADLQPAPVAGAAPRARRGGKLVAIDPIRTRTAAQCDQHLAIRPAPTRRWRWG
jgi:anaerobic selenocysteine-containing dehydrogenase